MAVAGSTDFQAGLLFSPPITVLLDFPILYCRTETVLEADATNLSIVKLRVERALSKTRCELSPIRAGVNDVLTRDLPGPSTMSRIPSGLPNEAVLHVLSFELLQTLFANIRKSLRTGGTLILDLPKLQPRLAPSGLVNLGANQSVCEGYFRLDSQGNFVRVGKESSISLDPRSIEAVFRYEYISPSGELIKRAFRRLVQRLWTKDEVVGAMLFNGFSDVTVLQVPERAEHWFIRALATRLRE